MRYVASYNRAQRGVTNVDVVASGAGAVAVVFPVPFAVAPVVCATTEEVNYYAVVTGRTTTGFTLTVRHRDSVSATVTVPTNWIAEP